MPKGRLLLPLLVIAGAAMAVNLASASNWPRFRGPNGTGVASDLTIPVKWSEKDIVWKYVLPGPGNGSPVVWNGRVFVQATKKDGSERMLLCLNAKDGSLQWMDKVKGKTAHTHANNTLSSATPGVSADGVFAVFWDGTKQMIKAYTHEGKALWSHDLGTFVSQHGAGASPIPIGDKVYFNNDQDEKAELICFDGKTGRIVWSDKRPFYRACYSPPFLRTLPDGKTQELVLATTMAITGYDPDTGAKHWNWKWQFKNLQLRIISLPVYDNGILFVTSGDGGRGAERHMVAIGLDGPPKLLWDNRKDFPYVPSMVMHGKHLYFVNDTGRAFCYEAATGKRAWEQELDGSFSSSPVLINGKIYAVNDLGDVVVFAADPTSYRELARNALGEKTRATPAVADERLFLRGERHLFCIGKR